MEFLGRQALLFRSNLTIKAAFIQEWETKTPYQLRSNYVDVLTEGAILERLTQREIGMVLNNE